MNCKICKKNAEFFLKTTIMKKYDVSYFLCKNCGFIQTEEPYWLKEAYNDPINTSDTGIFTRNILCSKITSNIIYFLFNKKDVFLDYAGGYGIFTRIMRDIGFDFYWNDPYCQNIFAKGFEDKLENKKYALATCFEAFEHFEKPLEQIESIFKKTENILFSTELLPRKISSEKIQSWRYLGREHGQHICFYSKKSLQYLSEIFGYKLYSNGYYFHLLTKRDLNPFIFKFLCLSPNYYFFRILSALRVKSKTRPDSLLISKK